LDGALAVLEKEVSRGVNQRLLEECTHKAAIRIQKREAIYQDTVSLSGFGIDSDFDVFCVKGIFHRQYCHEINDSCGHFGCTIVLLLNLACQWKYVQMATRFLYHLLRRDVTPSGELVRFFLTQAIGSQPMTQNTAQRYHFLLSK
jgi:hypothetical protein